MADQVEITNVGDDGVASEVTLSRLVRTMERFAKASGLDPKSQAAKAQKAHNDMLSKGVDIIDDEIDARKENNEELKRSTAALKRLGRGVIGLATTALGTVTGTLTGLAKELAIGGEQMSDFTQHIPIVGRHLTGLVKVLEEHTNVYRNLSEVGVNFGNSLIEMNRIAANSGMSLGRFSELMGENSERLTFFGANASGGAKALSQVSHELRRNFGESLLTMGYNIEDINEGIADYTQLQARLGFRQRMTQTELSLATNNYLSELDKLARITGTSRKEQERLMLQNATEANVVAAQRRLQGQALDNFTSGLAFIESELGPDIAAGFKDAMDGVIQTDIGKSLNTASSEFLGLAKDFNEGRVDLIELQRRLGIMSGEVQDFAGQFGGAATTALMGDQVFGSFFQNLYRINEFSRKQFDPAAAERAQQEREGLTTLLTNFAAVIERVRAAFFDKLLDSNLLRNLETFTNDIFSEERITKFANKIEGFIELLAADPSEGLEIAMAKIKEILTNGLEKFTSGLTNFWQGEQGENIKTSFTSGFVNFWKGEQGTEIKNAIIEFFAEVARGILSSTNTIMSRSFGGAGGTSMNPVNIQELTEQKSLQDLTVEERQDLIQTAQKRLRLQSLSEAETGTGRFFGNVGNMLGNFSSIVSDTFGNLDAKTMSDERFINLMREAGVGEFNQGTKGFQDFGKGTLAMLHGMEAVVPLDSPLGQMLSDINTNSTRGINISGLVNEFANKKQGDTTDVTVDDPMTEVSTGITELRNTIADKLNTARDLSVEQAKELNTIMREVLGILQEQRDLENKIQRNTSGITGNLAKGRVSNLGGR